MTSTPAWYYFSSTSDNIINTYNEDDGRRGWTLIYRIEGTTIKVEVFGNVYYDIRDGYTVDQRRGIAAHEVGHGISIGHIPNSYPDQALMYKYTPLSFFSAIYVPQLPDILLVNQVYP